MTQDQTIVLVVDDNPVVRQTIKRFFDNQFPDLRVEEAADGFQASEKFERLRPRLVILDLFMPGVDGLQVCRYIHGEEQLAHTRILGISGQDTPKNRQQLLEMGADAFLAKPFEMEELKKVVQSLLAK